MNTVFVRNRFDHEVRRVADVAVCTHEDSAAGDGLQEDDRNRADGRCDATRHAECARRGQEDQVSRRVVEEAREQTGRPEHLEGLGDAELRAHFLEDDEGRLHGDEDADEELGDLLDSAPGKVVRAANLLGRGLEGEEGCRENQHNLNDGRETEYHFADNVNAADGSFCGLKHRIAGQCAAEHHCDNDHQQEKDVVGAAERELCAGLRDVRAVAELHILQVIVLVELPEDSEQNYQVEDENREQMQAPEERHTAHKAHEERRIAERC